MIRPNSKVKMLLVSLFVWNHNEKPKVVFNFSGMETNTTSPPFPGSHSFNNSTCSRDNLLKTVVFPVLYSFLFLLGLVLNGVAVWVFFRIPSKSHFIIYLKNIVVADVIMTFTFPFKVCLNWYSSFMRHTLTLFKL